MENPNVGKNHGSPQTAENHYVRVTSMESTEATTSCTPSSLRGGYNRGNDLSLSLSLTLSMYTVTHTLYNQHHNNRVALSHIYTHMTFGLFTHMAPRSSLEHIHISVPSNRSGRSPPGLRSYGSS